MMLSFEYDNEHNTLQIYFDVEGKAQLLASLQRITRPGDHEHLMTPAWSGHELSDELHSEISTLINMVTLGMPHDI